MTTWAFQLYFSLPFCLKQNKYLFSQPRHLRVLLPDFSRQFSSCTPLLKVEHSWGKYWCVVFKLPFCANLLLGIQMGLKVQISLQELCLLWRYFLLNWVCPSNSLLYICFYWKPVLYCKHRIWRQLHVFQVESSSSGVCDQCMGKSSFPESCKHLL